MKLIVGDATDYMPRSWRIEYELESSTSRIKKLIVFVLPQIVFMLPEARRYPIHR